MSVLVDSSKTGFSQPFALRKLRVGKFSWSSLGALLLIGVLVVGLPKVAFTVSLLAYFVVFLVLELAILQKQTTPEAIQ